VCCGGAAFNVAEKREFIQLHKQQRISDRTAQKARGAAAAAAAAAATAVAAAAAAPPRAHVVRGADGAPLPPAPPLPARSASQLPGAVGTPVKPRMHALLCVGCGSNTVLVAAVETTGAAYTTLEGIDVVSCLC
jgi:hypothetical protein